MAAEPMLISPAKAASQLGLRSTSRLEEELRTLLLTVPPVVPVVTKAEPEAEAQPPKE